MEKPDVDGLKTAMKDVAEEMRAVRKVLYAILVCAAVGVATLLIASVDRSSEEGAVLVVLAAVAIPLWVVHLLGGARSKKAKREPVEE